MDSPKAKIVLSPVHVQVSPSSQKVNLTGSARKLSDSAADLFNLIQRWNDLVLKGSGILSDIAVIKSPSLTRNELEYPEGLQNCCNALDDVVRQMEDVVVHMRMIKSHLDGLVRLEEFQNQRAPAFLTWKPTDFADLATQVLEAFTSELQTKTKVKEMAAHCVSENEMMGFRALWAYQIHSSSNLDFRIDAMLKETGHR